MSYEMVEVEWVDSCRIFFEWTEDPEDAIKEYENYSTVIHSLGYLGADYEDRIILIGDDGHDQVCRGQIIPKVSIVSITRLEKVRAEETNRPFPTNATTAVSIKK